MTSEFYLNSVSVIKFFLLKPMFGITVFPMVERMQHEK